jgi:hypothetical protein
MEDTIVEWFHCPVCNKDTKTILEVFLQRIIDIYKGVVVCVDVRCLECNNLVCSKEEVIYF